MKSKKELQKIIYYIDSFLIEIYKWYIKENNDKNNDLGKLKIMGLFFLGISKEKEYLNIFNKFEIFTLGIYEMHLFDYLMNEKLNIGTINNNELIIDKNIKNLDNYIIGEKELNFGKNIVKNLKVKNKELINKSGSEIVDIVKKWGIIDIYNNFNKSEVDIKSILACSGCYI